MPEDNELDQKRTAILRKVAQCARNHQNSFTVPENYLEAARLVAEDSQKLPHWKGNPPFRLVGSTFCW